MAQFSANLHYLTVPGSKDVQLASASTRTFLALALTWGDELPFEIRTLQDLLHFLRDARWNSFIRPLVEESVLAFPAADTGTSTCIGIPVSPLQV